MKPKFFILIGLLIISLNVAAQIKGNEEIAALEMASNSEKLRKEGKIFEADKLLLSANELFPLPFKVNEVALSKMKIGDVKSANNFWNLLILKLKNYRITNKTLANSKISDLLGVYYYTQINSNFSTGDAAIGVNVTVDFINDITKELADKRNLEAIIYQASENAYFLNDAQSLQTYYDGSKKINSSRGEFTSKAYLLLLDKKYDEAIVLLNNVAENGAGFMMSKDVARFILPLAYHLKGDYQNMSKSIDKASKSLLVSDRTMSNYFGLRALYNKDYQKAIEFFTEAMKPVRFLSVSVERPGKYRFYSNRAETYILLNDISAAKRDFEAALIFNPDYQPALEGLAKLEGNQIVARKTDKTGPEIKILEPTNMRGLKVVTAGKDAMIKGLASDPSGLKEVTINGTKVYAKEDGNFWGSVMLKDGVNKILIVATDLAENKTEQTFEIEKSTTVIAAAPIAVTEKQGKNYAVFIASQNYDDTTIPSLENPIPDAIKLKLILKNTYNFAEDNIFTLFNPQRSDFKKKFLELRETLQPEDNLVIFYAGHGIWVDKEKKGYWLLTDAQRNDVNTWLPNKEVLDMIAELPSRHTLLITDACFSGSVFKTRSIGADAPAAIKEMDNKIARVAITSGNDTEVPDVSVFMKYLVKALSENKEKYLTAQKMFINQIIEAVMTESKTEPRYGTLELAGHVGGDFIFSKK
jgi:tetratricopeptide (TPR) repeat protein